MNEKDMHLLVVLVLLLIIYGTLGKLLSLGYLIYKMD